MHPSPDRPALQRNGAPVVTMDGLTSFVSSKVEGSALAAQQVVPASQELTEVKTAQHMLHACF